MHYGFAKDRLPSGLGYPLTRAQLDAALSAPCIELVGWVAFSRRRGDAVLAARYWGQDNEAWFAAGTVWLSLYAVPTGERAAVRSLLLAAGLPRLVWWFEGVGCRGASWRASDHRIELAWRCGRLIAQEDRAIGGGAGRFRRHLP